MKIKILWTTIIISLGSQVRIHRQVTYLRQKQIQNQLEKKRSILSCKINSTSKIHIILSFFINLYILNRSINDSGRVDFNRSSDNPNINSSTYPSQAADPLDIVGLNRNSFEDQNKSRKQLAFSKTEPLSDDTNTKSPPIDNARVPQNDIFEILHETSDEDPHSSFYGNEVKQKEIQQITNINQTHTDNHPTIEQFGNGFENSLPINSNNIFKQKSNQNGPTNRIYKKNVNKSLFKNTNNDNSPLSPSKQDKEQSNKSLKANNQPEVNSSFGSNDKLSNFMNSPLSLAVMGHRGIDSSFDNGTDIYVLYIIILHIYQGNNQKEPNPIHNTVSKSEPTDHGVLNLTHSKADIGKAIQMFSFRMNSWDRLE